MSTLYLNILADFRQLHSLAINIANAVVDFRKGLGEHAKPVGAVHQA